MARFTDYFQVERLLKQPRKTCMIIYVVYLFVDILTYFPNVVLPNIPSTSPVSQASTWTKWTLIWSSAYFLTFFILTNIYSRLNKIHNEQIKENKYCWFTYRGETNLVEDLFNQSFRSYKPMLLGFLFSFAELTAGQLMFGTVILWLDDAIVLFFIGIALYIFLNVIINVLKIGNLLRQNFEKSNEQTTIMNLIRLGRLNEISNFGLVVSTAILLLSVISAIVILPSFLDVFRYSHTSLGYVFISALVILPPVAFFVPMMNFHTTLSRAKERALEHLDRKIIDTFKQMLDKSISPRKSKKFEQFKQLRMEISSVSVWPINVRISYNLLFGSILPIIVSVVNIVLMA